MEYVMSDIWKSVKKIPTRREEEAREAARRVAAAKPKPYGKPGFTIDSEGRISYDPGQDPKGQAYK
jgi:hypothetical protein